MSAPEKVTLTPGTWRFRERGVVRDPALAHVVGKPGYPPEYVGGPETCETCGCPVAYFRKRGQPASDPYMVRITDSGHTVIGGDVGPPGAEGHLRCSVSYVEHTVADCELARSSTGYGVAFTRTARTAAS